MKYSNKKSNTKGS